MPFQVFAKTDLAHRGEEFRVPELSEARGVLPPLSLSLFLLGMAEAFLKPQQPHRQQMGNTRKAAFASCADGRPRFLLKSVGGKLFFLTLLSSSRDGERNC